MNAPTSVLARPLLPASIAIYTTVALAAFEGIAVAAAVPQVAADLGQVALLPWVFTAYLLAAGVATVTAGPLIDALGVKRMFRIAVLIFTVAGTAAAFAPSMTLMIVARVVHGVGGGLIIAVGLAAVILIYPENLVGRAFAANSTVWGVMGVAGPAIAAFMLTALSWRWIFLINLPLGIVALVAGWRVMPGPLPDADRRHLDVIGVGLVLAFNLALLLAVDRLGPLSAAWVALAVVVAWTYRRHARRVYKPVMRLRHLIEKPFGPLAFSIALVLTGAMTANSFVPLYVQGGRGESASTAAWSVLFFVIGWTLGSNLSSRLLDRRAETTVMRHGLTLSIPALALLTVAAYLDSLLPVIFALLLAAGTGIGATTNAGLTLLRSVTPTAEIGRATAAHQFYRNIGFTFGAAIGGAVLLAVVAIAVGDVEAVRDLLAGGAGQADQATADAISRGFTTSVAVGSLIAVSSVIPFRALRRHLAAARAAAGHR